MKKIILVLVILLITVGLVIWYSFTAGDNTKTTQFIKENTMRLTGEIVGNHNDYRDSICENGLTIRARMGTTEKEVLMFYKKVNEYCDCMKKYSRKEVDFIKNDNLKTFEDIESQKKLSEKFLRDQIKCHK